jgi:hypothetical protein
MGFSVKSAAFWGVSVRMLTPQKCEVLPHGVLTGEAVSKGDSQKT